MTLVMNLIVNGSKIIKICFFNFDNFGPLHTFFSKTKLNIPLKVPHLLALCHICDIHLFSPLSLDTVDCLSLGVSGWSGNDASVPEEALVNLPSWSMSLRSSLAAKKVSGRDKYTIGKIALVYKSHTHNYQRLATVHG